MANQERAILQQSRILRTTKSGLAYEIEVLSWIAKNPKDLEEHKEINYLCYVPISQTEILERTNQLILPLWLIEEIERKLAKNFKALLCGVVLSNEEVK